MFSKSLTYLAGLLFFSQTLLGGVITIGFETFPNSTSISDGTPLISQFPGLTFTNATVITSGISLNEFELPPHSGQNVAFDDGGPISISFASPVLSFGAYFTYLEPLTLAGFDAAHTQVVSAISAFSSNDALFGDSGSSPNEFLFVSFTGGISGITITGDSGGGSFVMDDAAFTTSPGAVPEPGSILLLLSGTAGLLSVRKRLL